MHHTDYSDNLRKAQYKKSKKWSLGAYFSDSDGDNSGDLVRAAIAAVLVVVALLQMDPANAQGTLDTGGYGTLQLGNSNASIRAPAVLSRLKMTVQDNQINMMVDQTFRNPTTSLHSGEYKFVLPTNAQVNSWQVRLENCTACTQSKKPRCQTTKMVSSNTHNKPTRDLIVTTTRSNGQLTITTPVMTADQRVGIHLELTVPNNDDQQPVTALLPSEQGIDIPTLNSVYASTAFIGSVAVAPAFGVLQAL